MWRLCTDGVLLAAGEAVRSTAERRKSEAAWSPQAGSLFSASAWGSLPREAHVVGLTIIVTLFNNKAPSD